MSAVDAFPSDRHARLEALYSLREQLGRSPAPLPPPALLRAAGDLLRRAIAAGLDLGRVDAALRNLPKDAVVEAVEGLDLPELESMLARAADEAVEAGLAEEGDERDLWGSSALEALQARDAAESTSCAVDRWRSLSGPLDPKTQRVLQKLTAGLERLDRTLRGKARWFTPLNPRRRIERDLLDSPHREAAWWFNARSGCDELIPKLSGQLTADEKHFKTCQDCRRDVERSNPVDAPPRRHLTQDDLWNYDLGLMPLKERRAAVAHAEECLECAQLLSAVAEGEKAIAEAAEWAPERPAARRREGPSPTEGYASTRRPGRHIVAAQNEFRVLVVRDARNVKLLVQPLSGRGLAAAAVHLLPRRPIEPRPCPEGLEFDLGESGPLMGQVARVRVRVTAQSQPFERDIDL